MPRRPSEGAATVKCIGLRVDGKRCTKWSVRGELKCWYHLQTRERQIEMSRAGGNARAAKYRRETRCRCSECGDVHIRRKKRGTLP
jgi:hypothetical protein